MVRENSESESEELLFICCLRNIRAELKILQFGACERLGYGVLEKES